MRRPILLAPRIRIEMLGRKVIGAGLVLALRGGKIAQKLAGVGILGLLGGAPVEFRRLALHRLGFVADAVEAEILNQPDRTPGIEPGHMLAPDERDDITEARPVPVDQPVAVDVLFLRHRVEDFRRGGIVFPQALGIAAVDARVVLLGRDGEREDFLFVQVREPAAAGEGGDHAALQIGMIPNYWLTT